MGSGDVYKRQAEKDFALTGAGALGDDAGALEEGLPRYQITVQRKVDEVTDEAALRGVVFFWKVTNEIYTVYTVLRV